MAAVNVTTEWSLNEQEVSGILADMLWEQHHVKASVIATEFTFTVKGYGSYVNNAVKAHGADIQGFRDFATDYHVLAEMLAKDVVRLENALAALDEAWSGDAVYKLDERMGVQISALKELAQNLEFVAQAGSQYADALHLLKQQWHHSEDRPYVYK